MKLLFNRRVPSRSSGFTLVEIAISLAVIAFALVAIIGVLPYGMHAQRDNREETIINADASVLISAIRNGERAVEDLTNYVYAVSNHWTEYRITSNSPTSIDTNFLRSGWDAYTPTASSVPSMSPEPTLWLTNGARIIGLMTRPKYEFGFPSAALGDFLRKAPKAGEYPTIMRSNYIIAFIHAMSGLATEKPPQDNLDVRADTFAYRVTCENQQLPLYVSPIPLATNAPDSGRQLQYNFSELRLLFRWPVSLRGLGEGGQVFRVEMAGHPDHIDDTNSTPGHPLYFMRPDTFVTATP